MSGENDRTLLLAPPPPLRALAAFPQKRIGRYQIRGLLGEGGMGSVYLAEQHEPIARIVALKLMRSTLAGPAAIARFGAERQAIARLSHPNVAAMYDAGATEERFPFFVMEHCRAGRSSTIATNIASRSARASNSSSRFAKAFSTRIRKGSSIAI